jgi:hypothetical protein
VGEEVEVVFQADDDTGFATARKGRRRTLRAISWVNISQDCRSEMKNVSGIDKE